MKIIYHHRTQLGDAQGIHITEMIKAFEKLGHKVYIFSLVKQNKYKTSTEEKPSVLGIFVKFVPKILYEIMELLYNSYAYFQLKKLIKLYQPDFIYERYAGFNFCGVLAAKNTNTKIILEVNSPLHREGINHDKLVLRRLSKSIENWVCNNATKCIVVSSALKEILIEQGIHPGKLNVISNGTNLDHFSKKITKNVRNKYFIPERATVIGIIAWYKKWHGLDLLIKMCHERDLFRSKNIYLLILGNGPAVPECKQYAKENQIKNNVIFAGSIARENVPEHINTFDLALQPKVNSYACPMKIIEYLVMGKVIIAPNQQNIRDILIHKENALLFEPDNMEDLYSQIEMIHTNKGLSKKLSKNAKKTIQNRKLTWIENAKKTIELIYT